MALNKFLDCMTRGHLGSLIDDLWGQNLKISDPRKLDEYIYSKHMRQNLRNPLAINTIRCSQLTHQNGSLTHGKTMQVGLDRYIG